MAEPTPAPSLTACAGCDLLQIYGCRCQPPTCRVRTWPGSPDCAVIRTDRAELAALRAADAAGETAE